MEKILFYESKDIKDIINKKQRIIINFMNSHDLYLFRNNNLFNRSVIKDYNINSIDGFVISLWLSIKNFRLIKRQTGPDFTINFFKKNKLFDKKMLFIGIENKDLDILIKKFPNYNKKNIFAYNPPYIKDIKFSQKEISKISKMIKDKKVDIVWMGLGCPKQNILSEDLYKKTKAEYFFNVGAAIDFILEKKKRSPKLFRSLGIEWLYRLLADFKNSRKKVLRSLLALKYLNSVDIK